MQGGHFLIEQDAGPASEVKGFCGEGELVVANCLIEKIPKGE
jgi:hypothetical protein